MADNVTAPVSTGTFATDDIGGTHYPRTKITIGADGAAADVHTGNPLPVTMISSATVPVSIAGTLPVSLASAPPAAALPAGTTASGSITTGGTAVTAAAANASRRGLYIQNISSGDLWVNELGGTAAANTAGSWKIAPGEVFSASTNRAVSIVGASAGQLFTGVEF
jgi:hypothetical protein